MPEQPGARACSCQRFRPSATSLLAQPPCGGALPKAVLLWVVRFSSAAVAAGSRASAAARSSVDLVEDKDYADICRDVGEVSVCERYRTDLSHTHTHRTQTHTRARTRRAHAPTWVRTIDFLWTACIRSTAGMRQVWCGRPRRHPPPAKERIFPAARPHQIAPLLACRCRRCRRCRASTVWFSRTVLHSAWISLGRLSLAWVLPTLAFLTRL